jgi:nucleotide-binding universal stress UspA family protein
MKRIIVGVDELVRAEHLIEWTTNFAHEIYAHVLVAHIVPRATAWMIAGVQIDYAEYQDELGEIYDQQLVGPLREHGVSAELIVDCGDPADRLAKLAADTDADFIVIDSTIHRGMHALIFGSVTHRLQHVTTTPVVVIPEMPHKRPTSKFRQVEPTHS